MAPVWVPDFTPMQLSAGRYLAYGLCAALFLAPRWKEVLSRVGRQEWIALAWLALLGNILYYVLLASAVQLGGVAMTTLITGLMPVAVSLIGTFRYHNMSVMRLLPSLLLGLAGVLCTVWPALTAPHSSHRPHQLLGICCAFGALATWTTYAVYNSITIKQRSHIPARDWSLLQGLMTGAQALLLVIPALHQSLAHTSASWLRYAGMCAGIAIGASVIGNAFWNRMSRLLPLTMTGQMILFEMLFALVYCFWWEMRWPSLNEGLAIVLLVCSVLLCVSAHAARPATREQPVA